MQIQSNPHISTPRQIAPKPGAADAPAQAASDEFKSKENQDLGLMPKPQGPEGPKESMASYIGKGALYGAALGFVAPALTIIGLAATPLTVPLGAVLGAIAGASAYTHPDYKPEA